MSSQSEQSQGGQNPRPTLPPIRDLFRDELLRDSLASHESPSLTLARLQVTDEHDRQPPRGHANPAPPMHRLPSRRSDPSFNPVLHAEDHQTTPFQANQYPYRDHHHPLRPQLTLPNTIHTDHLGSFDTHSLVRPRSEALFANPQVSQPSSYISTSYSGTHAAEDEDRTPVARGYAVVAPTNEPPAPPRVPQEEHASSSAKYDCQYCGKGFNRPSSLKIHLNSHTGEKPFVCPVEGCGRSFSVLSNMRRHARVHATAPVQEGSGNEEASGQSAESSSSPSSGKWQHRRNSSASTSSTTSRRSRSASSDDDEEDDRPEKRTRT